MDFEVQALTALRHPYRRQFRHSGQYHAQAFSDTTTDKVTGSLRVSFHQADQPFRVSYWFTSIAQINKSGTLKPAQVKTTLINWRRRLKP
jgi:hypothetical protein